MGSGCTQHHIKALEKDISQYCFIPGDHERGKKMAGKLEDVRLVSDSRGYLVHSGYYKGAFMTVCSTGMGGPQAAIAMEELGNMGARVFIRPGSAGGVGAHTGVGDIVIATASYRGGGTADEYLPKSFPAVANFQVTSALVSSAGELGISALTGPVASVDAFYGPGDEVNRVVMAKGGILCVEMESDTQFIIGLYRGYRCGAVFTLDNGPRTGQGWAHHGKDPEYAEAEDKMIDLSFDAMFRLCLDDGYR